MRVENFSLVKSRDDVVRRLNFLRKKEGMEGGARGFHTEVSYSLGS